MVADPMVTFMDSDPMVGAASSFSRRCVAVAVVHPDHCEHHVARESVCHESPPTCTASGAIAFPRHIAQRHPLFPVS